MVKSFQFATLPKINFSCGAIKELPRLIGLFNNKLILVTGKSSFIKSIHGKSLFNYFDEAGIECYLISVPGEPSAETVDNAVRSMIDKNMSLVVGIGGGSVIDAGKAISAMMYKPDSVKNYLEGVGDKKHPGTKLHYIAVPTTSGTGSEATKNAVISHIGKDGYKKSLRHDNFVPDIAIIDPELTLNCPKNITAASGMDCFTQLVEAYLSVKANEYTDALALEGLKAIKRSLKRSYDSGDDIDARTDMSFAALTSGICLANAGLGVVHGFASTIGGLYDIPHGLICGTLMATANELIVRELKNRQVNHVALKKYSLMGELFLEEKGKTESFYIDGFIDFLNSVTAELNLQGLKHSGINENDFLQICKLTENKNNPVKLGMDDLIEILTNRLT